MGTEIRTIRTELTATPKKLQGVAIRYGVLSSTYIAPGLRERIEPEAFERCFAQRGFDCTMDYDHQQSQVLGRVSAGNLRLENTRSGLVFECTPPDTSWSRDLISLVRSGTVKECSFGFTCDDGGDSFGYEDDDDFSGDADTDDDTTNDYDNRKVMVRSVRQATLRSISAVVTPAYGGGVTSVYARQTDVPQEVRSRALRFLNRSSDEDATKWIQEYLSNRIPSHGLSSKDAQNVANGILRSYDIREDLRYAKSNELMRQERLRRTK